MSRCCAVFPPRIPDGGNPAASSSTSADSKHSRRTSHPTHIWRATRPTNWSPLSGNHHNVSIPLQRARSSHDDDGRTATVTATTRTDTRRSGSTARSCSTSARSNAPGRRTVAGLTADNPTPPATAGP